MSFAEQYTLDQVHDYLLTEKLALHGLSSDVYHQNVLMRDLILSNVGLTGDQSTLLGIQLIGSRAYGTAVIDSDLDFVAVRYADDMLYGASARHGAIEERVGEVVKDAGVTRVDASLAPVTCGVASLIPRDPDNFVHWVKTSSEFEGVFTLFEHDIYVTSELRLCALAALKIMSNMPDLGAIWQRQQDKYADAYLGLIDLPRAREKLASRLRATEQDIVYPEDCLPDDLMQERKARFGLPSFDQYYTELATWGRRYAESVEGADNDWFIQQALRT